MNYSIEKAQLKDAPTLAYIQTESWKVGFKDILSPDALEKSCDLSRVTSMYKKLLEQNIGFGYILKINGKPHCIAYWNSSREKDMSDYAELLCIHSLPNQWRKGFGSKMMEAVLQDMADAGYSKVMLWVFEQNKRARGFYETLGFTINGREKPNIEPKEICYEKFINESSPSY